MKKLTYFADSHIHFRIFDEGKVENMLDSFQEVGLTHANLYSLPYRNVAEDLVALHIKKTYKNLVLRVFGGLHDFDCYADRPYELQVQKLLELGCDGIKIMCSPDLRKFVGYGLNDEKYAKMFAYLEENHVPVNIHLADPRTFWENGRYDSTFPTYDQLYTELFEVLDKYPKLNVVFAHFFFLSDAPDEAVRVMEKYPNVFFDLTPGVEMYYNFSDNIELWHDFFTKYSDRILFGTDANTTKDCNVELNRLVYRTLTSSHDLFTQYCYGKDFVIKGLNLSDEVVEKICFTNYMTFVGERINPVNDALFMECCKRIVSDNENKPINENYRKSFELIPYHVDDPYQQIAIDFCKRILSQTHN